MKMVLICLQTGKKYIHPEFTVREQCGSFFRYMRICGFTAESLRGERIVHETFPIKELQDYWSTRPRYEDKTEASEIASGTGDGKWQSYEEWQRAGTSRKSTNEVPPPPYSLEASASGPIASSSRQSEPQHPPPAPWSTRPVSRSVLSSTSY